MHGFMRSSSQICWSCLRRILGIIGLVGLCVSPAKSQVPPDSLQASLIQESIEAVLGDGLSVSWKARALSEADKKALRPTLKRGTALPDTLHVGRVRTNEGPRFLIPDAAPSKSKSFSLVLYLDEAGSVIDVDVLKYRENHGYEVDYPMFREQFRGKDQPGEVQFQRSIQNISGATISARSMTLAVHDLLAIVNRISLESSRPTSE